MLSSQRGPRTQTREFIIAVGQQLVYVAYLGKPTTYCSRCWSCLQRLRIADATPDDDLETFRLELLVADRDHVERRLERVEKQAKSGDSKIRGRARES